MTQAGKQSRTSLIAGATPGLALVVATAGAAFVVHEALPALSPLVLALALGVVLGNVGLASGRSRIGVQIAATSVLRIGVVLLGFQLAVSDVAEVGVPGLLVVAVVVTATFFGARYLGERLGLSPGLSLLTATGFAICGASAIAAMKGVADAEEEDVAVAIALVTICGSLAILLLPLVGGPLGLHGADFGTWVGASVHDVAQVVATAAAEDDRALHSAVIVKLTRVALFAPLVAGVTMARRKRNASTSATARVPLLPVFVLGFLVAVTARSIGAVPEAWLPALRAAERTALAAALVGLGAGVDIRKLARVGARPIVLGLLAWLIVAGVSYAGIRLFVI